jgi:hypothetical protein
MKVLQRGWTGVLTVAVTCAAGALLTPTAAIASTTRSYTYVAAGFHVVGPDLAAAIVAEETGIRTAPLGWVGMVPESDRITLRVTDRNPLAAVVAVSMVSSGGWSRSVCAPRGRDVVVTSAPVGQHVSLFVWDASPYLDWCPNNVATTGTLRITH